MYHAPIVSAARSHRGLVLPVNEDAVIARDDLGLWAVADGIGGEQRGRWASHLLCDILVEQAERARDKGPAIDAGIIEGNREIAGAAARNQIRIGSTLAAVQIDRGRISGVWVGDSRIYRLRDGQLERLTRDHSFVQELVDRGAIGQQEARDHPFKNILHRAVGATRTIEPDSFIEDTQAGDVYLLCSDGLSSLLSEDEIADRLGAHPAAAADMLLVDALSAGAPDNVSFVVVAIR